MDNSHLKPLEPLKDLLERLSKCRDCLAIRTVVIIKPTGMGPTIANQPLNIDYDYVYLVRVTKQGLKQWKWPIDTQYVYM